MPTHDLLEADSVGLSLLQEEESGGPCSDVHRDEGPGASAWPPGALSSGPRLAGLATDALGASRLLRAEMAIDEACSVFIFYSGNRPTASPRCCRCPRRSRSPGPRGRPHNTFCAPPMSTPSPRQASRAGGASRVRTGSGPRKRGAGEPRKRHLDGLNKPIVARATGVLPQQLRPSTRITILRAITPLSEALQGVASRRDVPGSRRWTISAAALGASHGAMRRSRTNAALGRHPC